MRSMKCTDGLQSFSSWTIGKFKWWKTPCGSWLVKGDAKERHVIPLQTLLKSSMVMSSAADAMRSMRKPGAQRAWVGHTALDTGYVWSKQWLSDESWICIEIWHCLQTMFEASCDDQMRFGHVFQRLKFKLFVDIVGHCGFCYAWLCNKKD